MAQAIGKSVKNRSDFSHTNVSAWQNLEASAPRYPITRRQMYAHGDTISVVPKGWGKGGEESVFRGYRISVLQDEDVLGSLVEQSECV